MKRYFPLLALLLAWSAGLLFPAVLPARQSGDDSFNRRAYEHFRNGLLLEMENDTDGAIKEYIRAAQLDSSNSVILKSLGDAYIFQKQNYSLGAAVYEKYLDKEPFQDKVISVLLQIYMQSRPPRLGRMENVLTKVISKGNDKPDYYIALIDVLLKEKKVEHAQNMSIMYYTRTNEAQESSEQIAELFKNNSMVVEGIEFFEQYLREHPGAVYIGIILGRLFESRSDLFRAEQAYVNVLNKNIEAYRARLHLAQMYLKAEKIDSALNLYDGNGYDDPLEIPVKIEIGRNLLQKSPDVPYTKVESIMESIEDKARHNADVYVIKGQAQAGQKRYLDSIESFTKALHEDPVNINALYSLAQSHFQLENYQESLKAVTKSVTFAPQIKGLYVLQGLIYDRMGDFEKAAQTYESGIDIQPQDDPAQATLLNNYSYLLSEQNKDLDKALDMALEAIRAEPDNSSFLDTVGWVYYKLGRLDEAMRNVKRAVELDPGNATLLDHLGDIYYKQGDIEQARQSWQKALDSDANYEKIEDLKLKLSHNIK